MSVNVASATRCFWHLWRAAVTTVHGKGMCEDCLRDWRAGRLV